MAPFNPELKELDYGDQTGRSRGISIPDNIKPTGQQQNQILPKGVAEGNRAAEYAGKIAGLDKQLDALDYDRSAAIVGGIDKGLQFAVGTTDALIKKQIERDVYDQANAEREGYIQELQGIKDKLSGPGPKLQNFLDANASTDTVPTELEDFGRTAERLEAARLQGAGTGRFNHADYATNLAKLAKDLRNRYPGYKDYVDQQMQKVTGKDPANFQIAQLSSAISNRMTGQDALTKRALSLLEKYPGLPQAPQLYQDVLQGRAGPVDVFRAVAPYEARRTKSELIRLRREDLENSDKSRRIVASEEIDSRISTVAGESVENFEIKMLGADTTTKFMDFVSKAGAGVYTKAQLEAAGQQLIARLPQMKSHMMSLGREKSPKTGRSLMDDAGGLKAYEEKVETALGEYKAYADAFYKGEYGFVGQLSRNLKGKMDQVQNDLTDDPEIGSQLMIMNAVRRMGGESNLNELYLEQFKSGMDKKMQAWTSKYVGEFQAGTRIQKFGRPTTLNDAVANGQLNGTLTNQNAKFLVESSVQTLLKSKISDDIKYNLVQSMYSDGNLNFVEKLNKDGVDSKGRPILGTYYTFRMMTSPDVTQEIAKLAKAKPELWKNYINWSTNTFRNLFIREIKTLQEQVDNQNITVNWISKDKTFQIKETGFTNLNDPANKYARQQVMEIKSKVQRLNDGLGSMKEIAKAAGKDDSSVESYLMDTLYNAGFRPSEKIKDLPSQFMQGVIRQRLMDESNKANRKKIEEEESKR